MWQAQVFAVKRTEIASDRNDRNVPHASQRPDMCFSPRAANRWGMGHFSISRCELE
jgi:hypothetical protein